MILSHNIWVNKLFYSFKKESDIPLLFEEEVKNYQEPVINLSIHPIRFSDDIFFNFQTNNKLIQEKLKKYEINR